MEHRSAVRRFGIPIAVLTALAVVVALLLVPISREAEGDRPTPDRLGGSGPAPTSAAAPTAPRTSCADDTSSWVITAHRRARFTHLNLVEVDDGIMIGQSWDLDRLRVLRAAVTVSAPRVSPVGVDAVYAQVVAKISRRTSVQVVELGSATRSGRLSINSPYKDDRVFRRYAGYAGRMAWSGRWSYRRCEHHAQQVARGTWTSYELRDHRGVLLCGDGRSKRTFAAGSWAARACRQLDH